MNTPRARWHRWFVPRCLLFIPATTCDGHPTKTVILAASETAFARTAAVFKARSCIATVLGARPGTAPVKAARETPASGVTAAVVASKPARTASAPAPVAAAKIALGSVIAGSVITGLEFTARATVTAVTL